MAATDPVTSITSSTNDHPVVSDLDMTLRQLAALPPSNTTPYLTALLDWQPDGSTPFQRQAQVLARDAANAIIADQEKRSAALESLTADVDGITKAIQDDIDPATRGIFAVGNSAQGILHVEPLGVPVETSVTAGPIPLLKRLAQLVEDYPLHALLQADQDTAVLSFVTEDVVSETVTVRGSLYPRRQKSGGLNERRYKARADERVQAFAKVVAAETQSALEETGCRRLVLAASEVMEPALLDAFHHSVKEKVIGAIRIDIDAPFDEVLEKARPLAVQFERQREATQVEEVMNALPSGNAVAGTVDVMNALRNGQVHRLIMTRVYAQPGWIDPEMQLFGIGDVPAEHPAGGNVANLLSVPLEEEMIRQAVQSGSQIEIVKGTLGVDADSDIPAAGQTAPRKETVQPLDDLGGVAAMLRWSAS